MGRRKIEMKKVTDNSSRQVTFSKRRTGLFKKAHEIATLCGAEVAIVVFSPGGKPFSFGHPDVDSIANRFLNQASEGDEGPKTGGDRRANTSRSGKVVERLNKRLTDVHRQLEGEKKKGEVIEKAILKAQSKVIPVPIPEMGKGEIAELERLLEDLRVSVKAMESDMEASCSLLLLANNQSEE